MVLLIRERTSVLSVCTKYASNAKRFYCYVAGGHRCDQTAQKRAPRAIAQVKAVASSVESSNAGVGKVSDTCLFQAIGIVQAEG